MLANLKDLLSEAQRDHYAIASFNVPNLEAVRSVIHAAERLSCPVILKHAEVHNALIPLEEIAPILLDYARRASVPVGVHLDHGNSFAMIIKAIRLGFTSVMIDAAGFPFEENVMRTKEVVKVAHALGVAVEAELGQVLSSVGYGNEGRNAAFSDAESGYTDPEMARRFVGETEVDCLVIGFGTVHGLYIRKPQLNLARVAEVRARAEVPLVMHGGSGVAEADFITAINNAICKVNYYTYMSKAGGQAMRIFSNGHTFK